MKKNIKQYIKILVFCKFASPFISVFYLFGWFIQTISPNLFKFMNIFMGFIPKVFNHLIHANAIIKGNIVSMGYVYTAVLFIFFYYFSDIFIKKLEAIETKQKNIEARKKLEEEKEIKKQKLAELAKKKQEEKEKHKTEEPQEFDNKMFFGLFEFHLEYSYDCEKNPSELEKLKQGFSKIMVNKLTDKYPKVIFSVDDKIYFICKEFSKFGPLTKDILTLFKTFMQTGIKQSIKTGMLFSYWTSTDIEKKDEILKILTKINELGYLNKIIVSSTVYYRFTREKDHKSFSFDPIGASKLIGVPEDDKDLDVELYSITKVE